MKTPLTNTSKNRGLVGRRSCGAILGRRLWEQPGRSLALPGKRAACLAALVLGGLTTYAVGPTVSNVRVAQRAGTQLVDI